jgi:hypothetical protein
MSVNCAGNWRSACCVCPVVGGLKRRNLRDVSLGLLSYTQRRSPEAQRVWLALALQRHLLAQARNKALLRRGSLPLGVCCQALRVGFFQRGLAGCPLRHILSLQLPNQG